ncbi:MAG: hypothetical protein EXR79_17155 [Myxococcales bacterium]|nr:hypothetical protein [Myxococcales bacterium]
MCNPCFAKSSPRIAWPSMRIAVLGAVALGGTGWDLTPARADAFAPAAEATATGADDEPGPDTDMQDSPDPDADADADADTEQARLGRSTDRVSVDVTAGSLGRFPGATSETWA